MKSKERPWVLTKEGVIHEVKKDHKGLKSQKEGKKERNDNNNKEKRRGFWLGQRTCRKDHRQRIYNKKSTKALGP